MFPSHHLLALVPNRIKAALERLHDEIWQDFSPVKVTATRAGPRQHSFAEAQDLPRRPVRPGTSWGMLFDQRWCHLVFPNLPEGSFLNWQDQGEATLYLDGAPYFGFDVAHRHCQLPGETRHAWIESNCVQSAIWHPAATDLLRGSLFSGAFLCRRSEEAWQAYHDLKCLFDVAMDFRKRDNPLLSPELNQAGLQAPVERVSPVYRQMLRRLDQAVDAYDRNGAEALRGELRSAYAYFRTDKTFLSCVLTGHAHIDLVWLWPERIGELKAVHSFATVNRLMETYPEFRFAYSQPASYEAVKRRAPRLYQDVMGRIRSGAWQATGAMYVESDTFLACGEALGRSFTIGQKAFREMNGHPARLNWLPDAFGFSACLPQLMRLTGVDYFFTTKMTWNAINRFPYSSYIWKGNDGSEVLAHVTQDSSYVTHMQVQDIKAPMLAHQQADVHSEYLLPTGYGDGGGGPTAEMCEAARRLGSLSGMPAIAWGHPEEFFDRLDKIRDRLPTHQGECYLEFHRGVFTSQAGLKESFRRLERTLQVAEAVAAATGKRWDIEHAWKRLVFAQFHDYIPGTSVWDVYDEGLPELQELAATQRARTDAALHGPGEAWCIFNPHAQPVRTWMKHPQTGREILVALPPLAGRPIEEVEVKELPPPVTVAGRKVSNGLVEFTLDGNGCISSLLWEGLPVPLRNPLGQLVLYPDRPANFDIWEIDRQTLSLPEKVHQKAFLQIWKDGDHAQGIQVTRKIGRQSSARVTYSLQRGSPLLHLQVDLDWNEPEYLLKMHFPTAYGATQARFGTPFGSVLRSQVASDLAAEAKWEMPFSRYLAVFDEGEQDGLFLVTEAKYGASVRDGNVGLSLVRSPRVPGFEGHAAASPRHLSRLKNETPFADLGRHSIRLALGRYAGDLPRERQPAALADTLFTEPLSYQGEPLPTVIESLEGGSSLVPAWVVPLEEGAWLVRFHEVGGRRGTLRLQLAPGWTWEPASLEGVPEPTPLAAGALPYRPYQIVSIRIAAAKG
jgi:alpha-mannosidase